MNTILKFTAVALAVSALGSQAVAATGHEGHKHGKWQLRTTVVGAVNDDAVESDELDLGFEATADLAADITYFITPSIAVSVWATYVNLEVDTDEASLGSVDLLPPAFTVQYHFNSNGRFKPFLGVGFNYNGFFNESGTLDDMEIEFDDAFGIVGEAGVDYYLNDCQCLLVNLNYKYITFDSDVDVGGDKADELEVDAHLIGGGFGYRF